MLTLYDEKVQSPLILGTARYPSVELLKQCILASGTHVITVSLRRESRGQSGQKFWEELQPLGKLVLPNTAGCYSVKEAVATAHLARELFGTNWIKLEVIADDVTLNPNPFGLVEAARILCSEGFQVFPYMTDDLACAEELLRLGVRVLMPWGSPIGSGQGLRSYHGLRLLRLRYPEVTIIIDAGIGLPHHATQALEMGCNGVMVNTAVAMARDPIHMATAFRHAVEAGRLGHLAGPMAPREFAEPSTPLIGRPFWHQQ